MTQVFVINSGSSSIKYQLIDVETEESVLAGVIERIGSDVSDHDAAMHRLFEQLGTEHSISAVGHRVVHGGSLFDRATVITDEVEAQIDELSVLAPLHNPANLLGIRASRSALPQVPHVAVFDTAFHQTLPPAAYTTRSMRSWRRRITCAVTVFTAPRTSTFRSRRPDFSTDHSHR